MLVVQTSLRRGHTWQRTEALEEPFPGDRHFVVAALSGAALAVATGEFAVWRGTALPDRPDRSNDLVAWSEVAWPKCKSAGCGGDVHVYLRAKLGFCNCATGVANDDDLDRMSDFDLVGGEVAPLASGQPVKIGNMNGHDRAYLLTSANPPGKSALSVVFNDRCACGRN